MKTLMNNMKMTDEDLKMLIVDENFKIEFHDNLHKIHKPC